MMSKQGLVTFENYQITETNTKIIFKCTISTRWWHWGIFSGKGFFESMKLEMKIQKKH